MSDEKTTTILDTPLGADTIPTLLLSEPEAALLRAYKKFLTKYGLAEALYCKACWNGKRADGCEAHVTDTDILIRCRCQMRFHRGQTF